MNQSPNYMTPIGMKKLRGELEQLVKVERPQVVATVAWAASNGDRSENADYIYGKRRLRQIDSRIRFLNKRIEAALVVDPKTLDSKTIVFGATITVANEEGEQKTYQIVGEDEIDTTGGKISWKSPMAKALLGKKEGDEVLVKKPNGESWLEVVKIQFI
ncbi:MAG: transcription elongation factor GreB [Bdellovibrionales bacterium]|nr:transcription elongation factor GreB [Bdellovibrionales bacterium]